jgi:hypothetical protein
VKKTVKNSVKNRVNNNVNNSVTIYCVKNRVSIYYVKNSVESPLREEPRRKSCRCANRFSRGYTSFYTVFFTQ